MRRNLRFAIPLPLLALALSGGACTTATKPQPPKPGTPAFFWAAAGEAFKKADFPVASKNLSSILASENEYTRRAQIWQLAVDAGLARGEMEWADLIDEGRGSAKAREIDFRRLASEARALASQSAMRFADTGHKLLPVLSEDEIALPFGLPDANKDRPVEIEKILKGVLPAQAEIDRLHGLMIRRGVLLSVLLIADPGGDVEKARILFSQPEPKMKREAFLTYMAKQFTDLSRLYAPKKLDRAGRVKLFLDEAKSALASVPPSPERTKLQKQIDEYAKELPKAVG